MREEVTIPAPISEAAVRLARRLGVSLDELFSAALAAYVSVHERDHVTEALDRVYEAEPSAMEPVLVQIQAASLGGETW
jgi:hypothetical protein